ncbi:DUF1684 domain-containing protein [Streptomyces phaeofaciens]|uniref:DUF1684 domain-containing protein n=1 Tax=Streptomyces phaeofaciens TaxID=68254 RepID=UPI00367A5299
MPPGSPSAGGLADTTGGVSGHRFRFLHPGAPDADERTTVDVDRAVPPPCAFAGAFVRPFPPRATPCPSRSGRVSAP